MLIKNFKKKTIKNQIYNTGSFIPRYTYINIYKENLSNSKNNFYNNG